MLPVLLLGFAPDSTAPVLMSPVSCLGALAIGDGLTLCSLGSALLRGAEIRRPSSLRFSSPRPLSWKYCRLHEFVD